MNTYLALLQSTIFIGLSALHFNWALGGDYGFEAAVPTKENGEKLMNPGKMDSGVVGFGLLLFAIYYLDIGGFISVPQPNWVRDYAGWVISTIFLLRAIGDFKYIGFFKKVNETEFGQKDSKFYAPLCLIIATIGFLLA